jgi:serine/threonine protein kinase
MYPCGAPHVAGQPARQAPTPRGMPVDGGAGKQLSPCPPAGSGGAGSGGEDGEPALVRAAMRWCRRTGQFGPPQQQMFRDFACQLHAVAIEPGLLSGGAPLGKGAFGAIERMTLQPEGREVAVKSVKPDVMRGPKPLAQVLHEVSLELMIIARIRHPRIVNFLGAAARFPSDSEDVRAWSIGLVLELCEGGEVNNLLHTRKVKFSMQEKLGIIRDTAVGLAYLHGEKVVHRDLSTRNLLLTGAGRVKIADYGCSRLMRQASYQPAFIAGSPPWMAPEQLAGKPICLKTDVWALGTILWELMAETPPFAVISDLQSLLREVETRGLAPVKDASTAELPPDLAPCVQQIINLVHRKHPAVRPSSEEVSQVLAGLQAAFTGKFDDADDDRPPESIYGPSGDHRVLLRELEARARMGERLENFYARHNASKLSLETFEAVLKSFDGDEEALNASLRKRYKADLNGAAPKTPTAHSVSRASPSSTQRSPVAPSPENSPSKQLFPTASPSSGTRATKADEEKKRKSGEDAAEARRAEEERRRQAELQRQSAQQAAERKKKEAEAARKEEERKRLAAQKAEKDRLAAEAAARKKREEEDAARKEEERKRLAAQKAEKDRLAAEAAARKKAEEQKQRKDEEERNAAEEAAARKKAEVARKEAERKRLEKMDEELRRLQVEQERARQESEAWERTMRKEAAQKAEWERQAEEQRRKQKEEQHKLQAEQEHARQEAERRQQAADKAQEAERRRQNEDLQRNSPEALMILQKSTPKTQRASNRAQTIPPNGNGTQNGAQPVRSEPEVPYALSPAPPAPLRPAPSPYTGPDTGSSNAAPDQEQLTQEQRRQRTQEAAYQWDEFQKIFDVYLLESRERLQSMNRRKEKLDMLSADQHGDEMLDHAKEQVADDQDTQGAMRVRREQRTLQRHAPPTRQMPQDAAADAPRSRHYLTGDIGNSGNAISSTRMPQREQGSTMPSPEADVEQSQNALIGRAVREPVDGKMEKKVQREPSVEMARAVPVRSQPPPKPSAPSPSTNRHPLGSNVRRPTFPAQRTPTPTRAFLPQTGIPPPQRMNQWPHPGELSGYGRTSPLTGYSQYVSPAASHSGRGEGGAVRGYAPPKLIQRGKP